MKESKDDLERLTIRIEKIEASIEPIVASFEARRWLSSWVLKYWRLITYVGVAVFALVAVQQSPPITIGVHAHSESRK